MTLIDGENMQGWLSLENAEAGFFKNRWERVFVTISSGRGNYYDNQDYSQHLGKIDFQVVPATVEIINKELALKVLVPIEDGPDKEFVFKALNKTILFAWVSVIKLHLA